MRHKHADLLIAYANDTTLKIEWQHPDGEWFDVTSNPTFHPKVNYRIKPNTEKVFVFLHKKGSGRWVPNAYGTMPQAVECLEKMIRLGYDVTDIKEVEFV